MMSRLCPPIPVSRAQAGRRAVVSREVGCERTALNYAMK